MHVDNRCDAGVDVDAAAGGGHAAAGPPTGGGASTPATHPNTPTSHTDTPRRGATRREGKMDRNNSSYKCIS